MRSFFANRSVRPYLLLVAIAVVLWILDWRPRRVFHDVHGIQRVAAIRHDRADCPGRRPVDDHPGDRSVGGRHDESVGMHCGSDRSQPPRAGRCVGGALRLGLGPVSGRHHGLVAPRFDWRNARRIVDARRSRLCGHRKSVDQLSANGCRARGEPAGAPNLFAAELGGAGCLSRRRVLHGAHENRP